MKVILLKDCVAGKAESIIEVKNGFAKNFLLPQKLAVVFNQRNQQKLLETQKARLLEIEKQKEEAEALKKKLENLELTFLLQTTNKKTHGAVSSKQIYQRLEEEHSIKLPAHSIGKVLLKEEGQSAIEVELPQKVKAFLKILIQAPKPQDSKSP